eukprot:1342133-Amorphochlora_amoeboformis.AAC.1
MDNTRQRAFTRLQRTLGQLRSGRYAESKVSRGATHPMLKLTEEVKSALSEDKPVIMTDNHTRWILRPSPASRRVENMVRSNGAIPATIAILERWEGEGRVSGGKREEPGIREEETVYFIPTLIYNESDHVHGK